MSGGPAVERILERASALRWDVGPEVHDSLMEAIYADAGLIAGKAVSRPGAAARFSWDVTLDRVLTNCWTGFPVMLLMLAVVFWLTIAGANIPSAMLASLLLDTLHPVLKGFSASKLFRCLKQ